MQTDESRQIHDAFSFVRKVGEEISALNKEIENELRNVSKNANEKYNLEYDDEEQKPAYRSDYWICEAWAPCYALSERGKRGILGYLYYLFDLSYTGGPAQQIQKAVVGVGYVGERTINKHPQKMRLDTFYPWQPSDLDNKGRCWELADDQKIWFWNGGARDLSDVHDTCWVYFVPLATVHSRDDVLNSLVRPPLEILRKNLTSLEHISHAIRFAKGQFKLDTMS